MLVLTLEKYGESTLMPEEVPSHYVLPKEELVRFVDWEVPRVGDEFSTNTDYITSKVLRVIHMPEMGLVEVHLDAWDIDTLLLESYMREHPTDDLGRSSFPDFELKEVPSFVERNYDDD